MLSKAVNISAHKDLNGPERTKSIPYLGEFLSSLNQETRDDGEDRQDGARQTG